MIGRSAGNRNKTRTDHHRAHTGIGGLSPIERVHNVRKSYI